jgi:RimJ/RimL family protein N-acetyltransferase
MNLILEQLESSDFSRIRSWIDPAVFHIFKAPVDDEQLEMLLSKESGGVVTEVGMRAVDQDSGRLVGIAHAILNPDDDLMHIQQIVVDPQRRGRGYGSAILRQFVDHCLGTYHLHRIQLFTEENNEPAIACYRKVGFKVDGILRDRVKVGDGYLSTYIFSILSNEWK